MPKLNCCCCKIGLSTFHWCCCCCTTPISNEKLPLLDEERYVSTTTDTLRVKPKTGLELTEERVQIKEIYIPKSYLSAKNKEIEKSKIRIVTLSDTHMFHESYSMPDADILIIAGDISNWPTTESNVEVVIKWLASLVQYKYKILIAGNHEVSISEQNKTETANIFKEKCDVIYLQDDSVEIFGLTIHGTPWHPKRGCLYNAEAFAKTPKELKSIFDSIPESTDILISHCPPYGVRDSETAGHIGSDSLLFNCVNRIKPIMHIFGHVHEENGISFLQNCDTIFVNNATIQNVFDFIFEKEEGTELVVQGSNPDNDGSNEYKEEE